MTTFYIRTQELCKQHKISLRKLETFIGAKENTSGNWKKTIPVGETVLKVASYFCVTTDYLLGTTDENRFCDYQINEDIYSILMTCQDMKINSKVTKIVNEMIRVLMENEV